MAAFWFGMAGLACIGPWADLLLLPPIWRAAATSAGQASVLIPWHDKQIEVVVRRSPLTRRGEPPTLAVLSFCGRGDQAAQKRTDVDDLIDGKAVLYWTVNYPGYGATSGPTSLSVMGSCALHAYDALQHRHPTCPIVVSGFSLGTVPALYVAARRHVGGVVLQNPPVLRDVVMHHGWWNLWSLTLPIAESIPDELDSVDNASAADAPGVLITARLDEVVPFMEQMRISEAFAGPKSVVVLDAQHDRPLDSTQAANVMQSMHWLADRIRFDTAPRTLTDQRPPK